MIDSIIEKKILQSPWPLLIDGTFYDGEKIQRPNCCDDTCINTNLSDGIDTCKHGLSHIYKIIDGYQLIVTSVYIPSEANRVSKKKASTYKKVSRQHINDWFLEASRVNEEISNLVEKAAKNNHDQFHEFAKWASEINFYSERLINKTKSGNLTKFEAASEDLKSLYKTSTMLLDALDTASIYFNPKSATFGKKRSTDLYGMIHKISQVLSHSKSNKNRARIKLIGKVENKHKVYESFKIVPLSLIQNALKYKKTGNVEVHFQEIGEKLNISVVSEGDHIEPSELGKLFDKGYRTKKAKKMTVEGSGLGLYILKIITDAHFFAISVSSVPSSTRDGIARNIFTVSVA